MAYLGGDAVAGQSPVFAKATDDERDFLLGNLGVFAVRPKALGVELLERLPCQLEPALAGRGVAGGQGLFCLFHVGTLPQPGASQQAVCGIGFHPYSGSPTPQPVRRAYARGSAREAFSWPDAK